MLDWVVGFGIEYSDGGVPGKLDTLSRQLRTVNPLSQALTTALKGNTAGVLDLGAALKSVTPSIGEFSIANRTAATTSRAATSAYRAQAGALWDLSAAAAAASASTMRVNAMAAGGFASAGAAAARSSASARSGATSFAIPAATGMRWAGGQTAAGLPMAAPLALAGGGRGGWVSPWAAGLMGAGAAGGGGGRRTSWGNAGRGWGGAPVGPPPGGGSGGGGSGGGFHPPGMSPSFAAGFAMRGVKYGAEAGLGVGLYATYEAAKLEQTMRLVELATRQAKGMPGASEAMREKLHEAAFDISSVTAQSAAQSASILGVIATGGIPDSADILGKGKSGESFAMKIAKFADAQFLKTRGRVSFEEGARQGIILAHQFGAYTPKQISPVLDQATKVSFLMPEPNLTKFLTQSAYYARTFHRMGVPDDQTLMLGAWQQQMGGARRGGTWLANLLTQAQNPLQMTAHLQKGRAGLAQHFGLIDAHGAPNRAIFGATADGHPRTDMFALLDRLNETIKEDRAAKKTAIAKADVERRDLLSFISLFEVTGSRIAMLADEQGIERLRTMRRQARELPGVDAAQEELIGTMFGQSNLAWTNFKNILTELGWQTIPGFTKGMHDLGESLQGTRHWMHQHKDLEKRISKEILDDVKGVEKWILHHHKDFETLGADFKSITHEAVKLGPELGTIADGFLGVYKAGKDIVGIANAVSGNGAWVRDQFDRLRGKSTAEQIFGRDGILLHRPSVAGFGDLNSRKKPPPSFSPVDAAYPFGTGHGRSRTREVVITHKIEGGNAAATHHLKHVVQRVVHELVNESSDPRHHTGRHGNIHTDPRQPTRHTTTSAP